MNLLVTSSVALLFALLLIYLSFNVIKKRRSLLIAIGSGNDEALKRAIAAHQNFCQYTPFLLISLAICELSQLNTYACSVIGSAMLIARSLHSFSILKYELKTKGESKKYAIRIISMLLTFFCLLVAPVIAIIINI